MNPIKITPDIKWMMTTKRGTDIDPKTGYFHAQDREEVTLTLRNPPFEILKIGTEVDASLLDDEFDGAVFRVGSIERNEGGFSLVDILTTRFKRRHL